jgi:hypothetical protein
MKLTRVGERYPYFRKSIAYATKRPIDFRMAAKELLVIMTYLS